MRSKQEKSLAELRAFSRKTAVTELTIFETQLKLFNNVSQRKLIDKAKAAGAVSNQSVEWSRFVNEVYRTEPTQSRSIFSGNLLRSIQQKNTVIKRFKKQGLWHYYLHN